MGGFSLGCGIGWSAPCVEVLKEKHEYDTFSTNVIASVFPLGAALGMPVVPFLVDKIGRKWTMMSLVPAFLLGWMFITIGVTTFGLLVMGRLITGACGGMFCVVAPMYSAEISEKEIRGTREKGNCSRTALYRRKNIDVFDRFQRILRFLRHSIYISVYWERGTLESLW